MKVCNEPGCPNLQPEARCPDHRRAYERGRGSRQARGYDAAFDAAGRDYQRLIDGGKRYACWRCTKPIKGTRRGIDWQLGHDDHDRTIIRGPEHPVCNLATSGRRA